MRGFRRGFKRTMRRLGPFVVVLAALLLAGFGAHAALDWHHHGRVGAGFFHLHVHVGHHHHAELEHHEHESPEPDSPSDDRRECGTLSFALGVAPAPAVATAERPILETNEHAPHGFRKLTDRHLVDHPWSPRGPPV